MVGNIQIQKNAASANTNFGFAQSGPFGGAGFLADPESQNLSGGSDPLQVIIPNSGIGPDALRSFSIIASGTLSNASGSWIFNLALDAAPPEPATPLGSQNLYGPNYAWVDASPRTPRQPLPQVVASAAVSISSQTSFVCEADVTNVAGVLSGTWTFSLNRIQITSGALTNLPGNFKRPIAAFLQIAAMPAGSSISGAVLAISVAGYNGRVQTLN